MHAALPAGAKEPMKQLVQKREPASDIDHAGQMLQSTSNALRLYPAAHGVQLNLSLPGEIQPSAHWMQSAGEVAPVVFRNELAGQKVGVAAWAGQ